MYEGSAVAFISKDNKILLHDRARDGKSRFGEGWGLIGGGKEGNETPLETLKREIMEELGFDIKEPIYIDDYYSDESSLLVHLYVALFPGIDSFAETPEGDMRKSVKLFTLKEVREKNILGLGFRIYADLNKKGYLK